jgi:hypothetical protein
MNAFKTFIACLALTGIGCSAADHRAAVRDEGSNRMTVGAVQRNIRVGMPLAEVAAALGAPNIVSTDEMRREIWIYDKIATERVYSTSDGSVSASTFGAGPVGGAAGGGAIAGAFAPGFLSGFLKPYYHRAAGAVSTTQGTLTVIVKFDEDNKVRDFAYHESRF